MILCVKTWIYARKNGNMICMGQEQEQDTSICVGQDRIMVQLKNARNFQVFRPKILNGGGVQVHREKNLNARDRGWVWEGNTLWMMFKKKCKGVCTHSQFQSMYKESKVMGKRKEEAKSRADVSCSINECINMSKYT